MAYGDYNGPDKADKGELAHHLLSVRTHAHSLNDHATVNFWTKDHEYHDNYHVNQMHDSFKELAEIMGYDVVKRDEPTTIEAPKCTHCDNKPITNLDGDDLCQEHANEWVRGEGMAAQEYLNEATEERS